MKKLFKCLSYWCAILMCAAAVVLELSQGEFSTVLWICLSCFWFTKYLLEMENCYKEQSANIELCFQLTKTTGLLVEANDLLRKMEDELHKREDKDEK